MLYRLLSGAIQGEAMTDEDAVLDYCREVLTRHYGRRILWRNEYRFLIDGAWMLVLCQDFCNSEGRYPGDWRLTLATKNQHSQLRFEHPIQLINAVEEVLASEPLPRHPFYYS